MREMWLFVCALAAIGTAWHALAVKAPEIEADIAQRADASVQEYAIHPVEVSADGRFVTVEGLADNAEHADALIDAANVVGAAGVRDRLDVLPTAVPYRFSAQKEARGMFLSGHVPSAKLKAALVAAADEAGGPVGSALELAAGAPGEHWSDMAAAGVAALTFLDEGRVAIEGEAVRLTGTARDETAREAATRAAEAAGQGDWTVEIALDLPVAEPYRFVVEKTEGGGRIAGNAPDEVTAGGLQAMAARAAPGATGTLTLANGMPDEDWPALAEAGVAALGRLAAGRLEISGRDVLLVGEVETDAERDALEPLLGEGWDARISVRRPDPLPELTLSRGGPEGPRLTGILPRGADLGALSEIFPDVAEDRITAGAKGDAALWDSAIDALAVILPRMETVGLRMTPGRMHLDGRLAPGFSAKDSRAALRIALGTGWTLDFNVEEAPPGAAISFTKDASGTHVTGILPEGLSANQALTALGGTVEGSLTGGGAGDTGAWANALGALGRLLGAYEGAVGTLGPGGLEISGQLAPGHDPEALEVWMLGELGEAWPATVTGTMRDAPEGTLRYNPVTGEDEILRQGWWLPQVAFEPSAETCDSQTALAQANNKIRFVTGSARIDPLAARVLNRLSAVVFHCLEGTDLVLEIGGHTDTVGSEDDNLALSERRAEAVRDALVERGVDLERMSAVGYGASTPIDSNDTEEGRARNRRISFGWAPPPPPETGPGRDPEGEAEDGTATGDAAGPSDATGPAGGEGADGEPGSAASEE